MEILLIDGTDTLSKIFQTYFEKQGHTVRSASSKPQALDYINSREPDIIIVDTLMRSPGGFSL